ncbi:type VII secretion protein EccCa [Streptomyces phyllanthi]|uniref:type VII secretion protein EccCa n=1 Tax=Streptomyces phyllanthi TaxID=1803180 RepID=UPI002AD3087C|nr:type VII secretion protein EccCa [Streptomyces phyllanthi]
MSTVLFRRPARRSAPELPQGEIDLQTPPPLPELEPGGFQAVMGFLPMLMSFASMGMMFVIPGINAGIRYVMIAAMGISGVLMLVLNLVRGPLERKRKLRAERRGYLRYLAQTRRQVRRAADQQRRHQFWQFPDPEGLWSAAMSKRLWERRPSHPDFGEVRLGVGTQPLGVRLTPPQSAPVEDLEPVSSHALRRFVEAYGKVPGTPASAFLRGFAHVLMDGDKDAARGLVRAVLAHLAVFHSPDDLRIGILTDGREAEEWEWAKWLPHAAHPTGTDAAGPVRLITGDFTRMEELLGGEKLRERPGFEPKAEVSADEPFLVIVVDGAAIPAGVQAVTSGYRNGVVIDLADCLPRRDNRFVLRLKVSPSAIERITRNQAGTDVFTEICAPDTLSTGRAAKLARLMTAYRLGGGTDASEPQATDFELPTLLGLGDAKRLDPAISWRPRSVLDQLRIPIGISEHGEPVDLDIKEASRGGMGPHGILIGATGSGKSELLRTLVLGLAATHSSEALNFVLVDFKGGATFLGLDRLPHTSAVITNLSDELPLVDRMQEALQSEMNRRQELLRAAGNYSSVFDYEKARAAGAPLDPLPSLFIVVDEFSELLSQKREFIDTFVMIGRLGRSLAVHLLLASQRLEEGKIHALQSHLSYRIGLRTFSASESRAVLGVPDAHNLPSAPGHGYVKTDTETLLRFRAAYVSGPYRSTAVRGARRQAVIEQQVVPFTSRYVEPRILRPAETAPVEEPEETTESMMDVIVDRLVDQGPPAHRVWLPPLDEPPTLDRLLPPLAEAGDLGLTTAGWEGRGGLHVPVGIVDRPLEQRRDVMTASLAGGDGHVAIVGATQSGKSTLARTLVTALALTHTPREVQFYCLDFGGGSLSSLRGLPHVGSVAGRLDVDRVTRTVNEVVGLLDRREEFFREHGIESVAEYRKARRAGRFLDQDPYGDVFLVIDGWVTMRGEFDKLEGAVQEICTRGLGYGVHLIVTSGRWMDFRPWLRDAMGTRFELKMGDAIDSDINSKAAALVPKVPGRGLTPERLQFLAAVPRIDGVESGEGLSEAHRDLVEAVAKAWHGPSAPQIKLLPPLVRAAELPSVAGDMRMTLGLEETGLRPMWHDFEQSPHLFVVGETETGKTNMLKLVAKAIADRYSPNEARVVLADTRRNLYDAVPKEYQLGYAVSGATLGGLVKEAAGSLAKRVPGADITPDRLPLRDWWQGPRLYLLIDDYDLLATPANQPLTPLVDLLAQGADIGLHLVIARSSAGAMRGMADPVVRRLMELGCSSLLFSCGREEGNFLNSVPPKKLPVGRAQLITRRAAPVLVQTGLAESAE